MVAVIHTSGSLNIALNYNEKKVQQGKAKCLTAVNYPKEVGDMNFYQKFSRLRNQAALNTRAKVNSVHISLNFDPSEKLSKEKLEQISCEYMEKIGFGKQPYLVYEHNDSGHPHIHIVSTNIKPDGSRLDMHNMGRNQSEKARREIEEKHGLVKAQGKKRLQSETVKAIYAQKLQYGKSETRRAIINVLDIVIDKYKYTSLPELNAVLRLYNVEADMGGDGSRTQKHGGLYFRALDEDGNKVGVPIKASIIYNKPTLNKLEEKFRENKKFREPHAQKLKNAIDWAILKTKNPSLEILQKALEKESIQVVIRKNEEGRIYGLTYVDHHSKSVFNGSDLGKQYSAKAILERCNENSVLGHFEKEESIKRQREDLIKITNDQDFDTELESQHNSPILELIDPIKDNSYVPGAFRNKKRKRKGKRNSQQL
jgi:hypothetical protein